MCICVCVCLPTQANSFGTGPPTSHQNGAFSAPVTFAHATTSVYIYMCVCVFVCLSS